MGWSYKDRSTTGPDVVIESEDIDTNAIWYKIIKVDSDLHDALEQLEEAVNHFISHTTDEFLPSGPVQHVDGYLIQTMVDVKNLDNK